MPQGITRSSIEGFDKVIKALNVEILAISNNTRKGLRKCAIFIRNDMQRNEPFIPVDKGILEKTWETHSEYDGPIGARKYGLRMGFSANYALWVHEMYGAVNWTKAGSGPGFLIKSINRNHNTILEIIHGETLIP